MKAKLIKVYIVTSLLLIAVLSYSFYSNLKFRAAVAHERTNDTVISYFNEVCLGTEYGEISHVTRKWGSEMRLYIIKDSSYRDQISAIKKVLASTNKLFSDGFKIRLTTDSAKANSFLFLASDKVLRSRYNRDKIFDAVDSNFAGWANFHFENNIINRSFIFVNTSKPFKAQKNAIIEEIVQSLGLGNDSELYRNSVFYQHKYDAGLFTPSLSPLDEKLVRSLYHPKMVVGLNRAQTVPILNEILDSDN